MPASHVCKQEANATPSSYKNKWKRKKEQILRLHGKEAYISVRLKCGTAGMGRPERSELARIVHKGFGQRPKSG